MPLREMDNIVYPVCKLCRDHEKKHQRSFMCYKIISD